MKQILAFLIAINIGIAASAQTNKGIDALYTDMYKTARGFFLKQYSDPATKLEACYYLGETYRLLGQKDSSLFYFEQGLTGETPSALCMVGKAGWLLAGNATQAEEIIKKAKSVKEYKKNPALYVAIAKAYAANKQNDKANEAFNAALEMNKKYIETYLAQGNLLFDQKGSEVGSAATKFESAVYFDPACKPALYRLAQIYYMAKNYPSATQYFEKLKAVDPVFPPYLKMFGDMNYDLGKYAVAAESYAEYLKTPEATLADQIRYAYALFFNKSYKESQTEISQILPKDPQNQVLKRLLGYNSYEAGDFANGVTQMQSFFETAKPEIIISSDYKYYARLLAKNNQDSLSAVNFLKAIETSTEPAEFYKEIALTYEHMKKYEDAANFFGKHVKAGQNVTNLDLFSWGKDCYFAGGAIDSVSIAQNPALADVRKALYTRADSVFAEVANRAPENYIGYFWRARVNSILDPETTQGLAKPYYEKVIEILEPQTKNRKEIIEAYQYLGYFYYLKEDKKSSQVYWTKILAIDPNHATAQQALKGLAN